MGIRVDKDTLQKQLEYQDHTNWKDLYFHKRLSNGELPHAIGGGIGQSRICILVYLRTYSSSTCRCLSLQKNQHLSQNTKTSRKATIFKLVPVFLYSCPTVGLHSFYNDLLIRQSFFFDFPRYVFVKEGPHRRSTNKRVASWDQRKM